MKMVLNAEMSSWHDLLTGKEKGIIELPTLAKEKGMKIFLGDTEVFPESFNECGEPIFSEEFAQLMDIKKKAVQKGIAEKESVLFNVSYQEREFKMPVASFDTVEGIKKYITCLDDIHTLLKLRKMYLKQNKENKLNEFILFSKYLLNKFGNISRIAFHRESEEYPDVFARKDFLNMVGMYHINPNVNFIPKDDTICPCCCQKFTIEDLKNSEFDILNSKICHESCKEDFVKQKNIWHIVTDIMDIVYPNATFDIQEDRYIYTPILNFHTEDGDIHIKRVDSKYYIEWQDNFKKFNLGEEYIINKHTYRDANRWDLITHTKSISVPNAKAAINVLQLAHLSNI